MRYFAYGSNMLLARIRSRVPSAAKVGIAQLPGHTLRFHKLSRDSSGKCNALASGSTTDSVYGVVYEIDEKDKARLDAVEGVGQGYTEKRVDILVDGRIEPMFCYVAEQCHIDDRLLRYDWYRNLVLAGAMEASLPQAYIEGLRLVPSVPDPQPERARKGRAQLPLEQSGGSKIDGDNVSRTPLKTGQTVLDQIFNERLAANAEFDQEVVALVRIHVGGAIMHSRAGQRLGEALIQLAKARSKRES